MGLMDELKKLAQPYGDEDDFFEGADEAYAPKNKASMPSSDQMNFEEAFAQEEVKQQQPKKARKPIFIPPSDTEVRDNSQVREQRPPRKANRRSSNETQVLLFNPKNFDDAGELATYLSQNRSLVMALEGIPTDTARRLLDFISGIAFAMNAKITPVSAKTYFITPENVDLLDVQQQQDDDNDF